MTKVTFEGRFSCKCLHFCSQILPNMLNYLHGGGGEFSGQQATISVRHNSFKVGIALFYKPPGASSPIQQVVEAIRGGVKREHVHNSIVERMMSVIVNRFQDNPFTFCSCILRTMSDFTPTLQLKI